MLQDLPRLAQPIGAVSMVTQASKVERIPAPRGMSLDARCVFDKTRTVPSDTAALHIHSLFRAYMSARTVVACEHVSELPMLLRAENEELKHAAERFTPLDNSLTPRPVSVTLLAHGVNEAHCANARTFLDGLAHLAGCVESPTPDGSRAAATTVSAVRMTVLAGVDASWYVNQVQQQALISKQQTLHQNGTVQVCVRWAIRAEPNTIRYRTEFQMMPVGLSPGMALEYMLNWFISLKVHQGTPFRDSIASSHQNVPVNAWVSSVHYSSSDFFALMKGANTVKKSALVEANVDEVHLEHTEVFVRISQRNTYNPRTQQWVPLPVEQAVQRHDSFHGFLVGDQKHIQQIQRLCQVEQKVGLSLPDEDTVGYALHTVAVQAVGFALKDRVSLYAVHYKAGGATPGVPICSPDSWMWRLEPAIVPMEDVIQNFYVVPCNRNSLLPADTALTRPFSDFFQLAYKLYTATFGGDAHTAGTTDAEQLPLFVQSLPSDNDPILQAQEKQALAAFGLDAASRRVTVGDAYAMLKANDAPPQLVEFMLQSTLRLGLNASVLTAMSEASSILKTGLTSPDVKNALENENERLKRVANAALAVNGKRQRAAAGTTEGGAKLTPLQVKALMKVAGRIVAADVALPTASTAHSAHYSTLIQALNASIDASGVLSTEVHSHALQVAERAYQKDLQSCVEALVCLLLASMKSSSDPRDVYVVIQKHDRESVTFNKVTVNGEFFATTPGALLDSPRAVVVLIKMNANGSARITTTKRI